MTTACSQIVGNHTDTYNLYDDFVDDQLYIRFVCSDMHCSDRFTVLLLLDGHVRKMEESQRAAYEAGTFVRELLQNDDGA